MVKRLSILILLWMLPCQARERVEILPVPDFQVLKVADFAVRQGAQLNMIPWISSDPIFARDRILKEYFTTKDPELRARLYFLLERAYFPPVKGYLGIRMNNLGQRRLDGITITAVMEGSQADLHDLRVNDRITRVGDWVAKGGRDLNNQLIQQITSYRPGEIVKLSIIRGGQEMVIDFRLGVFPTPCQQMRDAEERDFIPATIRQQVREFNQWLERQVRVYAVKL